MLYFSRAAVVPGDIYVATSSTPGVFVLSGPLASLNSPDEDGDVWLSPDMKTAYFASCRGGTAWTSTWRTAEGAELRFLAVIRAAT